MSSALASLGLIGTELPTRCALLFCRAVIHSSTQETTGRSRSKAAMIYKRTEEVDQELARIEKLRADIDEQTKVANPFPGTLFATTPTLAPLRQVMKQNIKKMADSVNEVVVRRQRLKLAGGLAAHNRD